MARRWRGDGVAAAQAEFDSLDSFLTSNTRGSESPLSASNKRSSRKLRKEELHHAASGFTSLRLPPMFSKKAWELRQKSPMWKMAPLCAAASVVQKRVHNHTILKALEGLSCSKMWWNHYTKLLFWLKLRCRNWLAFFHVRLTYFVKHGSRVQQSLTS